MAMSDCKACWDTPCSCGHEYRDWTLEGLEKHVTMLLGVLDRKRSQEDVWGNVKASEITTVGQLREVLLKVPGGVGLMFQVVAGEDPVTWMMSGNFKHFPEKATFSTISLHHPTLKKLPKVD